jgi:hypothetical protein
MSDHNKKPQFFGSDFPKSLSSSATIQSSSVWAVKLNRLQSILTLQKTELLTDLGLEEMHLSWLETISTAVSNLSGGRSPRALKSPRPTEREEERQLSLTAYSPPGSPSSANSKYKRDSVHLLKLRMEELKKIDCQKGFEEGHRNWKSKVGLVDIIGNGRSAKALNMSANPSGAGDTSFVLNGKPDTKNDEIEGKLADISLTGRIEISRGEQKTKEYNKKNKKTTAELFSLAETHWVRNLVGKSKQVPKKEGQKTVKFRQSITARDPRPTYREDDGSDEINTGRSRLSIEGPSLIEKITSKHAIPKILKSQTLISKFDQEEHLNPRSSSKDKIPLHSLRMANETGLLSKDTLYSITSSKVTPRRIGTSLYLNNSKEQLDTDNYHLKNRLQTEPTEFPQKTNHHQMLTGVGLQRPNPGNLKPSGNSLISQLNKESAPRVNVNQKEGMERISTNAASRYLNGLTHTPIRSTPSISDSSLPQLQNEVEQNDPPKIHRLIQLSTKDFVKLSGSEPKGAPQASTKPSTTENKGARPIVTISSQPKSAAESSYVRIGKHVQTYMK